jgi:ribonuclease HI
VSKPVLAELLRFIAANEELPHVLKRYPGFDRDSIGKLVNAAADRVEEAELDNEEPAPAKGKSGLRVRKVSEVERAARQSAEEVEAAMNESKAERERKRKERVAAAEKEREAELVQEARPPRARLFTDGAARGNPGPAGAGAVIMSPEGRLVAKMGKFLGENTNNYAEYMGLLIGLKRAKAMGIKELEVLTDSELMVRQLNGDYAVKAENLKPLYAEAKALLGAFSEIGVRHIPREENKAADEMSNRAIDERL